MKKTSKLLTENDGGKPKVWSIEKPLNPHEDWGKKNWKKLYNKKPSKLLLKIGRK